MKILHLDSGLFVDQSVSRKLSKDVVAKLQQENDATVVYKDLVQDSIPHLQAEDLFAEEKPLQDKLIAELKDADVLVIGAPMYNFSIPSQLKAWFDRVLQAGVTFRYTENGAEGLLEGKKAYIASGRGGIYSVGEAQSFDHQEAYLKALLGFIGITDVEVVRAEGVAMGEEAKEKGLSEAAEMVAQL